MILSHHQVNEMLTFPYYIWVSLSFIVSDLNLIKYSETLPVVLYPVVSYFPFTASTQASAPPKPSVGMLVHSHLREEEGQSPVSSMTRLISGLPAATARWAAPWGPSPPRASSPGGRAAWSPESRQGPWAGGSQSPGVRMVYRCWCCYRV